MASNFNNFTDNKPMVINSGVQTGIVRMNADIQNGHRTMSGNSNGPWPQSTQQMQGSNIRPAQNHFANQGYTVSQISSPNMNVNHKFQNNSQIRLQTPQRMSSSNMVQRAPNNAGHLWQGQPARAMHPNVNSSIVAAPGSPSRTIPPSWPTSSPRQTSTISIQRPTVPTNNSSLMYGQQQPTIKTEVIRQPSSHQTIRVVQPNLQQHISLQNSNNQVIRLGMNQGIKPGMGVIRIQQVRQPKLEGVAPQSMNINSAQTSCFEKRQQASPMNNTTGIPTKIQATTQGTNQSGPQQMIKVASPAKLGISTPPKMKIATPKKLGINKTPLKHTGSKVMGKSPMKVPGKPGLVKPTGSVTSSSNAVYKEWKNKFGSHDENGFHCNMCPERKSFTADSSLRRHYTQTHEQICKTCKMEFSEEHLLQQHYREKHEFKCLLCSKVFTAFSSVRRHHEKEHPGQELPKGGTPIKSEPIISHENNSDPPMTAFDGTQIKSEAQNSFATPSGPMPSLAPSKNINLKMSIKSPMKKSIQSPMKKFAGSSMKKIVASPGKSPGKGLTSSDNAFSNRVYKIWKDKFATEDGKGCKICPGKVFSAESSLKRHYKQTHELVCAQCKMEFPEEHLLKEHHREQHEFWCFPCNKVFTAYSSLKRHNVQAHDGVPQGKPSGTTVTDTSAPMELPDPASLGIGTEMSPIKPSIVQTMPGSPPINKIIKKPFGTPLKSPMRKLSISGISKSPGKSPLKAKESRKDTPFSSKVFKEWQSKYAKKDESGFHCLVCPKSFTLDSSLKRHYKNMHELVCKCCSMQFSEDDLLKAHHKEKHEYWCTPCNRVFTLKSSLIRHNVQQHGAVSPKKQGKIKLEDEKVSISTNVVNPPTTDPNIVIPPVDIEYQGLRHEDIAEDPAEDELPENLENMKYDPETNEQFDGELENYQNHYQVSAIEQQNDSNIDNHTEETGTSAIIQNMSSPQCLPSASGVQKTSQKRSEGEFPCPECNKMFSNKGNMNRHYNSTHVFPCKVCKQKFVEKELMEAHYFEAHVMHCTVCKKPFSNKGNLNRHMKQAHGQELPKDYQAPIQGKPLKQGTPTKNAKQQAISKISSPKPKHGINKLPHGMQNIQRLPLPQFRPGLNPPARPQQPRVNIISQTNNIRLAQPNIVLQQQNYTSQNQQIYHEAMTNNMQQTHWNENSGLSDDGWMAQ